jgi:hypothetical protein
MSGDQIKLGWGQVCTIVGALVMASVAGGGVAYQVDQVGEASRQRDQRLRRQLRMLRQRIDNAFSDARLRANRGMPYIDREPIDQGAAIVRRIAATPERESCIAVSAVKRSPGSDPMRRIAPRDAEREPSGGVTSGRVSMSRLRSGRHAAWPKMYGPGVIRCTTSGERRKQRPIIHVM